jgi:hypothetical protein
MDSRRSQFSEEPTPRPVAVGISNPINDATQVRATASVSASVCTTASDESPNSLDQSLTPIKHVDRVPAMAPEFARTFVFGGVRT